MNGLRRQLIANYNSLTKKLNKNIKKWESFEDEITISTDEIENEMQSLRDCIVILSCIYDEEKEDFDVIDDMDIETFNDN